MNVDLCLTRKSWSSQSGHHRWAAQRGKWWRKPCTSSWCPATWSFGAARGKDTSKLCRKPGQEAGLAWRIIERYNYGKLALDGQSRGHSGSQEQDKLILYKDWEPKNSGGMFDLLNTQSLSELKFLGFKKGRSLCVNRCRCFSGQNLHEILWTTYIFGQTRRLDGSTKCLHLPQGLFGAGVMLVCSFLAFVRRPNMPLGTVFTRKRSVSSGFTIR